jgi:hypothetical protein
MWQYGVRDFDPKGGKSAEDWAAELAAQGWRIWYPTGVWLGVNGRRMQRWSLRRWTVTKSPMQVDRA